MPSTTYASVRADLPRDRSGGGEAVVAAEAHDPGRDVGRPGSAARRELLPARAIGAHDPDVVVDDLVEALDLPVSEAVPLRRPRDVRAHGHPDVGEAHVSCGDVEKAEKE